MIGKRLQKRLTSWFYRPTNVVLRRPLESAQYLSIKYTERLAEAGIEPSVGSVGDSYDNTLAETIDGLYKAEVIHRRGPWRTMEALKFATLEWVDWFNNRRLLEPIGNIPPAEARGTLLRQVGESCDVFDDRRYAANGSCLAACKDCPQEKQTSPIARRFEYTRIEFRQSLTGYLTHFSLGGWRHLMSAHAEDSVRRKVKFNLIRNVVFRI